MPGSQSNLQRHEYYKHGTCYSKDPNRYFLDALTLTKKVDSTLGEYFRANVGKKVKAINAKRVATKLIDKDIKNKIAFKCKGRVLSEVWISIKGRGDDFKKLLKGAKPIRSNCTEFIIDAPGKFRRR
jgi:ribonuclease T2